MNHDAAREALLATAAELAELAHKNPAIPIYERAYRRVMRALEDLAMVDELDRLATKEVVR